MRPVLAGMMRAESLVDCSIDLAFVALLNDAINVKEENQRRVDVATKPKG